MPLKKKKTQPAGPRPRRSLRTAARLAAAAKGDAETKPEVAVLPSESGFETRRMGTEDGEKFARATTDSAIEIAVLASSIETEIALADTSCDAGDSAIGDGNRQEKACGEGGEADPIERLSGDEVREERVERSGAEEGTLETAIGDSVDGGGKTSPRDDVVAERVEGESGVVKKKKVVKIVKKLVKKRVSKGLQKSLAACSNKELERDEVVGDGYGDGDSNGNASSLMAVEKPNLVVDGAKNPNSHTGDSVEVRKLNLAVEGAENPAYDPMEVEGLKLVADLAENHNSPPDGSMEVDLEKTESGGRGKEVSVAEVPLQLENNEDVVLKPTSVTEVPEEHTNVDLLSGNCECGAMFKEEGVKEAEEGVKGAEEGVKGAEEKGDNGNLTAEGKTGIGAIALSGELEALERRKRRQTEIFIGGLDKDTKEEDIRKVFEDSDKIVEVRLLINGKTGKNKGYGFVRFASAADAKRALEKHPQVEVNFFEFEFLSIITYAKT